MRSGEAAVKRLVGVAVGIFLAFGLLWAQAAVTNLNNSAPTIAPQLHRLLTWTSAGGAANDIRCAHNDITDTPTFDAAWSVSYGMDQTVVDATHPIGTLVATEPTPKANGQADSYVIVGLKPNTTYFCAMKTDGGTLSTSTTFTTAKYEGYGYLSQGGGEGKFCRVQSTADSVGSCPCTGSDCTGASCTVRGCQALALAEAGNPVYVVFSVGGGPTPIGSALDYRLSFWTMDGSTAPSPGVSFAAAACLGDGFKMGACGCNPPTCGSCTTGAHNCGTAGPRQHQILTYVRFIGNFDFVPASSCCVYNDACSSPKSSCVGGAIKDRCLPPGSGGLCSDTSCGNEGCVGCEDAMGIVYTGCAASPTNAIGTNIVIDHVTSEKVNDSAFDISGDSQEVTFSWNLGWRNWHMMLISGQSSGGASQHFSLHHNAFLQNSQRNPRLDYQHDGFDYVNNVVWNFSYDPYPTSRGYGGSGHGFQITKPGNTNINIVSNYFAPYPPQPGGGTISDKAVDYVGPTVCGQQGQVITTSGMGNIWSAGNRFPPTGNCDSYSTVSSAISIPAAAQVTTSSASNLWATVLPTVGTIFRTAEEQAVIDAASADTQPALNLLVDPGMEGTNFINYVPDGAGSWNVWFPDGPHAISVTGTRWGANMDPNDPPVDGYNAIPRSSTSIHHSGSRSIEIDFGDCRDEFSSAPESCCASPPCAPLFATQISYIGQPVLGLSIGQSYRVSGWVNYVGNGAPCPYRSCGLDGRGLYVKVNGTTVCSVTGLAFNTWTAFSCYFQAPTANIDLRFNFLGLVGPGSDSFYLDEMDLR